MVVCLVLELQQPFLCLAVHIHVHVDAAGVVLLADFHIVEQTFLFQIFRSYGSQVHKIQSLVLSAEFLAYFQIQIQSTVEFFFQERILDFDILKFRCECSMTAMIAPICIQNPEFGLVRVTAFRLEIIHDFPEVIGIHGQSHLPAIRSEFFFLHGSEAFQYLHRNHRSLLGIGKLCKIFLAGFDRIYIVMFYFLYDGIIGIRLKNDELRTFDPDIGFRLYQFHAFHG